MSLRVVLSGVPGIYRSASSRLGALEGWRVLAVAGSCLALATLRAGGRPRAQNALRHFAFSAWLAARYDEPVARSITDEHERHTRQPLDSETDQRNNEVGRRYGLRHPEASAGTPVAVWRLMRTGRDQWREGR